MEKFGHAGIDDFIGTQKITTPEQVCFSHFITLGVDQLRGAFRILLPQLIYPFICSIPVSYAKDGRPPVAEDCLGLRLRPLLPGDPEDFADSGGQGVCFCIGSSSDGETHPAQIVVLVIITVPPTVVLFEIKSQDCSARIADRLFRNKDGLTWLISTTWTRIDPPGRLILTVD